MNVNLRKTAIAVAVTALVASPAAFAQSVDDQNADADILHQHVVIEDWDTNVQDIRNYETTVVDDRDYDITVDDTRNFETNVTNRNYDENVTVDADVDANVDLFLDAGATIRYNGTFNERTDSWETNEQHVYGRYIDTNESHAYSSTWDVTANEQVDIDSDIRREQNEHGRSVYLSKDLSVSSDIAFSGAPTISGDIVLDSAAIAVVDGRQSVFENEGNNDMLTNDAVIEDAGADASGNLGFNVAAGDNNVQDNAAALSAADASFAFGMADAEIFNSQVGADNLTNNAGVTNNASIGGDAFSGASGNINVNVAAGNNNAQRNSLAASVATSAYAQASVASDQVSARNVTNNEGTFDRVTETLQVSLSGSVSGNDDSMASYSGEGAAYQMGNFYPDTWGAATGGGNHPDGTPRTGHIDLDDEMQGAIANPNRDGVGGLAFDTEEEGTIDLSDTELAASLTGTLQNSYVVAVAATNSAGLSGSAFSGASGNIGVNLASGTGNLQSNSLSMAVAQPSAGGGGETPPPGE